MNEELQSFFYSELREQEYAEGEDFLYDDYAQGSVELESYDP
jgi:hypothetical protein